MDFELKCGRGDCPLGACASVTTAEGETVSACSLKEETGSCGVNRDCLSNKCTKNTCAPGSPLSNGSSCVSASDCQSMICKSGYCRGSALLGDACTSSYDCGIGGCCLQGASKNTCAQACD